MVTPTTELGNSQISQGGIFSHSGQPLEPKSCALRSCVHQECAKLSLLCTSFGWGNAVFDARGSRGWVRQFLISHIPTKHCHICHCFTDILGYYALRIHAWAKKAELVFELAMASSKSLLSLGEGQCQQWFNETERLVLTYICGECPIATAAYRRCLWSDRKARMNVAPRWMVHQCIAANSRSNNRVDP